MTLTEAERAAISQFRPRVSVRRIATEVAEIMGLPVERIMGRDKKAEACRVREVVCYLARQRGMSFSQIGRDLGRDHTTIISAVRNEQRRRGEV